MEVRTEAAIQELETRAAKILEDAQAEAKELLRIAGNLRGSTPADARPVTAPATQPSASSRLTGDQFRGMTRSMALELYMRARRNEGRIPLANVVLDLLAGGLDMGPHRDRWERQIMAVANNKPRIFGYDPERRELWLAPTADERPRGKAGGRGRLQVNRAKAS